MRSMLLNSQLDERFILDVLSSFQFYALNKEPREFLALLSSVTKLVRLSTDNIKEEAVPLSKEIKFIEKYIEIKLMSHSKPYTFDWKIPKKLDSSQVLVPAMYVQPYVAEVIDWILSVNCKSPVFFMNYKVNISNQVTMTFSATTRDKENMSKLQRRKQQAIRIKDFKCKESRRGFLNAIKGKNAYEIKRYSLFDSSEIQRGCEVELTFPEN
ncbi:MAG: histidine kinase [bacterium]|nr:histidine kinase [bacterium]